MRLDDMLAIQEMRRNRFTTNRYVTDSNQYWREELHPRVRDILPQIQSTLDTVFAELLQGQHPLWGFPVDEQSIEATGYAFNVVTTFINHYLQYTLLRRLKVMPSFDDNGNATITVDDIAYEFSYAIIMAMWDLVGRLIISSYPLVPDDLRHRVGNNKIADDRRTNHDSISNVNQGSTQATNHDSISNVGQGTTQATTHTSDSNVGVSTNTNTNQNNIEARDMNTSNTHNTDTTNAIGNTNERNVNDVFLSPQDLGVKPTTDTTAQNGNTFEPLTHDIGINAVAYEPNADFTTQTNTNIMGNTNTTTDGASRTSSNASTGVNETDNINTSNSVGNTSSATENLTNANSSVSNTEATETVKNANTVNSNTASTEQVGIDNRHNTEQNRKEDLNLMTTLQAYYNLTSNNLFMQLDTMLYTFYLNSSIARNYNFINNPTFN
jgi:hypothetical protein